MACRRRRPANELLRIARTSDGPRLDLLRRLEGRGCHVCPTPECVERAGAHGGKSLRRALRCDATDDLTNACEALRNEVQPRADVAKTAPTQAGDTPGGSRAEQREEHQ